MTVIAYDHKRKTISVDSAQSCGELRCGKVTKYVHLPDGGMAFGAGMWTNIKRIFAALAKSETPDYDAFSECTIILVRNGAVWEMDGSPTRDKVQRSWAWGTGKEVAIGALYAGASSDDAAGIAAKFDVYCGGPINTFQTRDV